MAKRVAVAGYGAVGRALIRQLCARGDNVRIVQRQEPSLTPNNTEFARADLEDAQHTRLALTDVDVVVCTVGIPYVSKIYTRVWPIVMRNMLDACANSGARFVFADNLYMYGPQTSILTEDMPRSAGKRGFADACMRRCSSRVGWRAPPP